jgi:hypothetical protein
MQSRIWLTALAIAALAGVSVAAASEREIVNGVTVLRGKTPNEQNAAGPATGSSLMPGSGGGYAIDQSGVINATRTGSSSAGGEIANPPPGAGR